ncbi:MAG: Gfo/Idh/MocA family protein [Pirellulaceae bacterium]
MSTVRRSTRRRFLAQSSVSAAGAFAAPYFVPARAFGANERVVVGFIGVGGRGMQNAPPHEGQIAAACDVDKRHLAAALRRFGENCQGYSDFRRVLDRKDIDGVVITTPDHWHAIPTIEACKAGKHVYCEKPLSLFVTEGRKMVEAARKYQVVVQCGSQQRSSPQFRLAAELFGGGAVGQMQQVRVGIPAVNFRPPPVPDSDPPAELDYDFWLGPAPYRPYNEKRVHYLFRFFWDYSGGQMTNFGAHDLDIVQLALGMDNSGPVKIQGTAEYHPEGWYEVPNKSRITYEYATGVKVVLGQEQADIPKNITFIGSEGTITVSRRELVSDPPEVVQQAVRERNTKLGFGTSTDDHHRNWLECIKSGQRPNADVEIGHRSATVCHLGNIAARTGEALRWDPAAERIVGNERAASMLDRPYRAPWGIVV